MFSHLITLWLKVVWSGLWLYVISVAKAIAKILQSYPFPCCCTAFEIMRSSASSLFLQVAPRVEKTEVFSKGWNFASPTYFASCIMRKHYFLLWTKETAFFPYFYHGIIFYSAELFDCAVNFKFYLNIFIFLNINTNQTSKEQYLN